MYSTMFRCVGDWGGTGGPSASPVGRARPSVPGTGVKVCEVTVVTVSDCGVQVCTTARQWDQTACWRPTVLSPWTWTVWSGCACLRRVWPTGRAARPACLTSSPCRAPVSCYSTIRAAVERWPGNLAWVHQGHSWNYEQYFHQVTMSRRLVSRIKSSPTWQILEGNDFQFSYADKLLSKSSDRVGT